MFCDAGVVEISLGVLPAQDTLAGEHRGSIDDAKIAEIRGGLY